MIRALITREFPLQPGKCEGKEKVTLVSQWSVCINMVEEGIEVHFEIKTKMTGDSTFNHKEVPNRRISSVLLFGYFHSSI